MILEMRVYIEKRHKSREIELVGAWFTPPIDYDELEERIGVTDQEPDYVIRDYELPFEIDDRRTELSVSACRISAGIRAEQYGCTAQRVWQYGKCV